jgi:L-2-hydroxyglutarate oxidase
VVPRRNVSYACHVEKTDVLVVGAGAVGLATAWQLTRAGVGRVVVLEKEEAVARHQTGRNSGVLHSGIYYAPGSMKAETCRIGKLAMEAFCQEEGVRYERCGKVVVATDAAELPALKRIAERAQANGVRAERIGPERLLELEPSAHGLEALWVPDTGIADFIGVCHALVRKIQASGGDVRCRTSMERARVTSGSVIVETNQGPIEARAVVACAGLQADRAAQILGIKSPVKIVPFRGEYHLLGDRGRKLVKNLIYPVPDPRFPFLGVHFTRRFDGSIDCGPNAVLALGREAYSGGAPDLADLLETLAYPGFLKLARRHLSYGIGEMHRSLSKTAFAKALQKLVPSVTAEDLLPGPNGIRAQAVAPDGSLLSDFSIAQGPRMVCVLNAPSPAATASLEIGRIVARKVAAQLGC